MSGSRQGALRLRVVVVGGFLAAVLVGCGSQSAAPPPAGSTTPASKPVAAVDAARLTRADSDAAEWLTYGRTYDEHRSAR